jgi:hypothetical protein
MLLLAELGVPDPSPLLAVTVNVYEVSEDSPETVIGPELAVPVNPPGFDVAV